jgi:hypothetical protein
MRKKVIHSEKINRPSTQEEWLDLENIASVEVTSEDPHFPIEAALGAAEGAGWRAAERGKQNIRIIFDKPRTLRRIRLEFYEAELNEPRSSHFDGLMRWLDRSEKSFASSGTSVRKAH